MIYVITTFHRHVFFWVFHHTSKQQKKNPSMPKTRRPERWIYGELKKYSYSDTPFFYKGKRVTICGFSRYPKYRHRNTCYSVTIRQYDSRIEVRKEFNAHTMRNLRLSIQLYALLETFNIPYTIGEIISLYLPRLDF